MWKAAIRSLLERRLRLALTTLSIVLGVGFVSGTYVLTDSIDRAFEQIFSRSISGFDLLVRARAAFGDAERNRIPETVVDDIKDIDGVAGAEGSVEDLAILVDEEGKAIGGQGPPTIASTATKDPKLQGESRLTAGRRPRTINEVVIDRYTAEEQKWTVGRKIKIVAGGPVRDFTLVGLFEVEGVPNLGGATVVLFDLQAAQEIFGRGDTIDSIAVRAGPGVDVEDLRRRVDRKIDEQLEVISRSDVVRETQQEITTALGFLSNALLTFGFIALFVGAFLIFNTFSILFAQRKREFAMLRAIGAKGSQVFRVVIAETLLIGLVASAVGVAAGFVLAIGLQELLKAFEIELPTSGTPLLPRTIIVGMVVGTLVTLFAGLVPAFRASRISPLAALREASTLPSKRRVRARVIFGLLFLAGGVALLVWGMFGKPPNALIVLGSGAGITLLAVSILAPAITKPLANTLGWPIAKSLGISAELARANTVRDRYRTAATASALMIGVALVAMITVLASSIDATAKQAVADRFRADVALLVQRGPESLGIPHGALAEMEDLPEIGDVTNVRLEAALTTDANLRATRRVDVGGIVPEQADRLIYSKMTKGKVTDLTDGIFIHEDLAKPFKLDVGETLRIRFPTSAPAETKFDVRRGPGGGGLTLKDAKESDFEKLEVQGIFSDGFVDSSAVVSMATYEEKFIEQEDIRIYADAARGVSAEQARKAAERLAKQYPNVRVFDQAGLQRENSRNINQLLNLVNALLGLALVIALFGIVNTLVLSVIERTREIGLLRAVGLTRRQVRRMIRWESIIVSLMGAVLGTGVGVFFAWILFRGLRDQGLEVFSLPGNRLAIFVAGAAIAGIFAAIGPARRASRVDVLRAIAYE
jgi:putative ABC transport system permease protein